MMRSPAYCAITASAVCSVLAGGRIAWAQPAVFESLGQIDAARMLVRQVTLQSATEIKWYRIGLPSVSADRGFIDMWTMRDYYADDQLVFPDIVMFDDQGRRATVSFHVSFAEAVVSLGASDPRSPISVPAFEIEPPYLNPPLSGQHGSLEAGVYWIAIGDFLMVTPDPWGVISTASSSPARRTTLSFHVQPGVLPYCDADFNWDGNVDQEDVWYLANVIAGGENVTGRFADYNRDGNEDQDDIRALIDTIAGGPCP